MGLKGEKKMKKSLLRVGSFAYFFAAFFVLFSGHAHAYIDPSAVSFLVQGIAAVAIAIGACLTVFRHKIVAFFSKGSKAEEKKEIHLKEDISDDENEVKDESEETK